MGLLLDSCGWCDVDDCGEGFVGSWTYQSTNCASCGNGWYTACPSVACYSTTGGDEAKHEGDVFERLEDDGQRVDKVEVVNTKVL